MYGSSTGSGSSRRYGRGAAVVSDVFARAPTADPFLFEDSDSNSPVKASKAKAGKKLSSAKSSAAPSNDSRGFGSSNNARKHNTRNHTIGVTGSSSRSASSSSNIGKQPSSSAARIVESDRLKNFLYSDTAGTSQEPPQASRSPDKTTGRFSRRLRSNSSSANSSRDSSPINPVSRENVFDSSDPLGLNHVQPVSGKSTRSLRSNNSSASSSRDTSPAGLKTVGLDRLSQSAYDMDDNDETLTASRIEESDRLKAFLSGGEAATLQNTTNSKVSKSKPQSSAESSRLQAFLGGSTTSSQITRHKASRAKIKVDKPQESDRMKAFLSGGDISGTSGNATRGRPTHNLRSNSCSSVSSRDSSPEVPQRTEESDKLKAFMSRAQEKSNHSTVRKQESDRLQNFMSGNKTNTGKTNGSLAANKKKESRRLRAFLGEAVSSSDEDEGVPPKSGLTQDMRDVDLASSNSSHSSPLKRRYEDEFDFSSDEDASQKPAIKPAAKTSRTDNFTATKKPSLNKTSNLVRKTSRTDAMDIAETVSHSYTDHKPSVKLPSKTTDMKPVMKSEDKSDQKLSATKISLSASSKPTSSNHTKFTSASASRQIDTRTSNVKKDISKPSNQIMTSGSISKPKINFEKMEGRKEKATAKPTRKLLQTPGKATMKYRYNHRAWLDDEEEEEDIPSESSNHSKADKLKRPLELKKVTVYPDRIGDSISTQVKVRQDQKKLYTVVRNVRQAHECQDHGENQQIDDDLKFLLDGLKPREATSSRYLSAVSLAKKCTNPTFRMYLRSQGSLSQIFTSMRDAPTDPRLALSATTIMFMLSQDRLNMDLDRSSLQLIVELLEYDDKAQLDNKRDVDDYKKSLDTVYDLYKSAIPEGEELVEKRDMSPGYLAMECLLILTSRRSGDWFKEELREVGALACISDSIIDKTVLLMGVDYDMELSTSVLVTMKKICRGLRVLEHVTACNEGNQKNITQHQDGEFVRSLCRLLMFGVEALPTHCIHETDNSHTSPGHLILQLLLGILRVLVNLTHGSVDGCESVSSFDGVIEILLKCILQSPQYVLDEQRFDLLVLGIGLSINMCENSAQCRQTLLDTETVSSYDSICESESMTADEALLMLFHQRLSAAEKVEAETGNLQESDVNNAISEDLNESITEVLHKAGRHMEDTIVASYIALLMGVILQHSPDYTDQVKQHLPDHSFSQLINVLQKFFDFMKVADAASGNSGSKSIATVINYLKEYT